MKSMRYITKVVEFLLVWVVIAVAIGFAMLLAFPVPRGDKFIGVHLGPFLFDWHDWRNLPGGILGLLIALWSVRASLRGAAGKDHA